MNKNIIIAILVVIIIAAAAVFMFGQNSKLDTQINFLSGDSLANGDQLEFELKDAQGNPIANQIVNLTFGDEKYSLVTDENGKGQVVISEESAGKYDVSVDYGGDDKHNGCSGKTTVSITDDSNDSSNTTSTNSSSSVSSNKGKSNLNYDAKSGLYYDNNGKVQGGQADGMSINDIRQRGGTYNGIN